ncbi:ABC transporter substrate-binding protein [Candidatus Pantoea multigeneris]|uniref:ABC transporter substrate-binding protein n=1 Tax=Candidatus Pantoea multigeneris TaxID=2608357 RepID=A0ABX0RHP8_9GAMM|nr:ABC transporter substrate-binding protein [Pantoea multigeneris]NIF23831.1 ABC transporter substrate-binding protein [Pantoea multigeneris]
MSKFRKEFGTVNPTLIRAISEVSLSRRSVMKLLSAGAVMSTGLIGFPEMSVAAENPVKGGKLRAAMSNGSALDTLDPARSNNSADYTRQYMFYSCLLDLDKHNAVQPALAETWSSDDNITWHFNLRKGVQFHDGKPLTSDDVVFSLNRHKDPAVGSNVFKLVEQMKTIRAVDTHQVEIVLAQPNADLPPMLACPQFFILQEGTKTFTKAIGTGPFVCKEFTPGMRTVGVKNPNYFKPGLPHLDEVELLGITDDNARINGLMSGDLMIVSSISAASANRLKTTEQFGVLESKSGMYTDLILRADMKPGNNADFVLAMKSLQPREMMVKTALQGYGDIANDTPFTPWNPYYRKDLPPRPIDIDKAKYHVKKAGMTGATVELVTMPGIQASVEASLMIQQIARGAGLNFNLRRVPNDGYWSTHWTKDAVGYGSINPRPTIDMLLSQFYLANASNNECHWNNPQFDQLVVAARGESDQARRKQMYGDIQEMIYNQSGTLIPCFVSMIDGYSKKLKGLESWPSGMVMGYRFHEFAWLSA